MLKIQVKKSHVEFYQRDPAKIDRLHSGTLGCKTISQQRTFTVNNSITLEEGNQIKNFCKGADDVRIKINGRLYDESFLKRI